MTDPLMIGIFLAGLSMVIIPFLALGFWMHTVSKDQERELRLRYYREIEKAMPTPPPNTNFLYIPDGPNAPRNTFKDYL